MIGFQGEGRFKSNLDEGMSCYIFSSNNFRTGSFLIFFFIIDYLNIENERKTRKKKKKKEKIIALITRISWFNNSFRKISQLTIFTSRVF